jgi:hypothetical protein
MKISHKIIFLSLLLVIAGKVNAAGSSFILSVSSDSISVGQPFRLDVSVDPAGEKINTLGGQLVFSERDFSLVRIDTTNSIIADWVEKPRGTFGKIDFSGIIPGGFNGLIDPFTPEVLKPGPLFSAYFIPKREGNVTIHLENGEIYLADGATSEKTSIFAYSFDIKAAKIDRSNPFRSPLGLSIAALVLILIIYGQYLFRKQK